MANQTPRVTYCQMHPFLFRTVLLTHRWEDKGVHIFTKGISPKVNVITLLEIDLAYYDSAVQRFNYYTTGTPPHRIQF